MIGPPRKAPFIAAATLAQVDLPMCRAVDDHTVEIALHTPSFEFPLALSAYGTKIVQDGATDFSKPVGTGPFVFESFEAGRQFTARANEWYWDGPPAVRHLRLVSADADARLAAVQSGQIDYADNLTPSAARVLRGRSGISVRSTPNSGIYFFAMKTDRAPFDNPDVRRAVMRMVDRKELVKVALGGMVRSATTSSARATSTTPNCRSTSMIPTRRDGC
ncbi:ABC transporter substrate-binding protein [Nocardia miyunensis]|uniref:ABC transporter substrate-binding protein n=1 Tax=Nocardia miyunensis TaxID=282684 RepID=UPI0008336212|nr:ABC transporter substrate-binding protein [Nocardia miyunensis]